MSDIKKSKAIKKANSIMDFYNSPIISGTDLIHAEFMDRNRMAKLLTNYDSKASRDIEKHLEKHDIVSTKARLKLIKAEIKNINEME